MQHVVVAMDGSVYAKYGKYRCAVFLQLQKSVLSTHGDCIALSACRERLRLALVDVCGAEAAACVELQLVQDGSVRGAAFLAMAAAQWEEAQR